MPAAGAGAPAPVTLPLTVAFVRVVVAPPESPPPDPPEPPTPPMLVPGPSRRLRHPPAPGRGAGDGHVRELDGSRGRDPGAGAPGAADTADAGASRADAASASSVAAPGAPCMSVTPDTTVTGSIGADRGAGDLSIVGAHAAAPAPRAADAGDVCPAGTATAGAAAARSPGARVAETLFVTAAPGQVAGDRARRDRSGAGAGAGNAAARAAGSADATDGWPAATRRCRCRSRSRRCRPLR